ncbi:uncharacterized protein LOC102803672 [Saccoglossus kowalevskii]|uniref:Uncharacterized protein LOC102803672 n=1 Tax=Saccoglossus kowalevskii TaxID=10224 RepID=A0ABM0LYL1_SACKO|nr:PREDICTED: uncharacterized protein LOC102803672 [Saccoglossus kowalevskii]
MCVQQRHHRCVVGVLMAVTIMVCGLYQVGISRYTSATGVNTVSQNRILPSGNLVIAVQKYLNVSSAIKITNIQRRNNISNDMILKALTRVTSLTKLRQSLEDVIVKRRNLTIGVTGGSISTATGVESENLYANLLSDLLSGIGIGSSVQNGAVGATGSLYHFYCMESHLNLQQLDILLWECAENDLVDDNGCVHQEELTRRILSLPSGPQLIYVNFIMSQTAESPVGTSASGNCSKMLSKYYDVPSISLLDSVDDMISARNTKSLFSPRDHNHPSTKSHNMIAIYLFYMIKNAFVYTLKEFNGKRDTMVKTSYPLANELPESLYNSTVHINQPQCWTTMLSGSGTKTPLEAMERDIGWRLFTCPDRMAHQGRVDKKRYWVSRKPNQTIVFSVSIEPYKNLKSKLLIGKINENSRGPALVWLDGEFSHRRHINVGYNTDNYSVYSAFTNIAPGNHAIAIRSGERPLKISTIISVYDKD